MARIDGTAGKDRLFGTRDRDELFGFQDNDLLYGLGGNDFLNGGEGDDRLVGGTGDDQLYGGSGSDMLGGGSGLDFLDGGQGADTMSGGTGNDTYYVDDPGDRVTEAGFGVRWAFGDGRDTVVSDVASYNLPKFVEILYLRSGAISGTGNSLDNAIYGNDRDNVISGLAGNDVLKGEGGRDTLFGGSGSDILEGGTGADWMAGGPGDDTYFVDQSDDVVVEVGVREIEIDLKHKHSFETDSGGHDLIYSSAFAHRLPDGVEDLTLIGNAAWGFGNELDNVITGNELANLLDGGSGNDRLDGRLGGDLMKGGTGNDIYVVDHADDEIVELAGEGIDTVESVRLSYTLPSNIERLLLEGFAVSGTGNELDNFIRGNALANALNGATGRDTLIGGMGGDTLTGGAGMDLFVFSVPAAKSGPLVPVDDSLGIDTITDFVPGEDTIGLISIGAKPSSISEMFVAGASPSAKRPGLTILYDTGTGDLSVDLDGSGAGAPVQLALFPDRPTLTAGDFLFLA